ncbi:MAG: hypothetical protein ACLFQX_00330 [Candidatus Kapaibacterium sp.]
MNTGRKFNIWLIAAAIAIFALNWGHVNQQGTFREVLLPAAQNIIDGEGYTHVWFDDAQATYPLWGYSLMLIPDAAAGADGLIALAVQLAMAVIAVNLVYRMFGVRERLWHIPLWLPWLAFMSVRWPDAPAAFFIIAYIYYHLKYIDSEKMKHMLAAGLMLGLASNFRSDFLYLPGFVIVGALVFDRRRIQQHFVQTIAAYAVMLFLLAPWAIGSKAYTDDFRLTATNGGGVAYISLGQLPGNAWGIAARDETAIKFARSRGIDNPYSARGDSLLKHEFFESIKSSPVEYAKKIAYNLFSIAKGGVYTGEYAGLAIGFDRRYEINHEISGAPGIGGKIGAMLDLPAGESVPLAIEKLIQAIFVPIFLGALAIFMWLIFTKQLSPPLRAVAAAAVVYKILLAAALLYEYRMMNPVYPLLIGASLWWIARRRE